MGYKRWICIKKGVYLYVPLFRPCNLSHAVVESTVVGDTATIFGWCLISSDNQ